MRKIIQKLGRKNFVIIFSLFSILLFMASDFLLAYLLNHQFNYQDSILRTTVIFVIFLPLLLWQLSAGFYELGKLEKLVKNLSAHDELTGLLNKSMFYRSAEKLHKIAIRNKQYYCILLIDIDDFKIIIDKFGQDSANKILSIFGQVSRDTVRDSDILARMGNQDFAFYLPNTNIQQAESLSNRLFDKMRKKAVINKDNKYIQYTASIGISLNPANELQSLEKTISMAKDALDIAKNEGGNNFKTYYQ